MEASHWSSVRRLLLSTVPRSAVALALLPYTVHGQTARSQASELSSAMEEAKTSNLSPRDVEIIAKARAVNAIPTLEVQFARTEDLNKKLKIADGLVRLGDKDNRYWEFLLQQATDAVNSDIPEPFRTAQGSPTGRQLSPEFTAWTKAHHADTSTAIASVLYDLPSRVMLLGETGDPRGIPLLRRALQSHNYQIVAWAAKGLAQIQDKQSIPFIIAAVQAAPPDYTVLIAESLVYFDDPQAQDAVETYIPKDKVTNAREAKASGRGVFGW